MIIVIIIISMIFLCGCWDRIEPERQGIVTGAGIDYNQERDLYQIVFQFVSPLTLQVPGAGGGGGEKPNFWTVSAWGHSPYDALSNLNKKVSRRISFSHAGLYVFTEKMAKTKGILPLMNAITRSRPSRRIIIIAVVKKDVEKLLSEKIPIESSNVIGLINQIRITQKDIASSTVVTARDFFIQLVQPGLEPHAVGLELIKKKQENKDENKPAKDPPFTITGSYIFRNDRVVGLFSDRETRGLNWIIGKVDTANLLLTYPDNGDNKVDIITGRETTEVIPIINNGKPEIKLKIKATGMIVTITGESDLKTNSKVISSLKKRMAEVIRNDIEMALKKAKSLKSDVFGFGNAFYRLKYNRWQQFKNNWYEIYPDLPVEIEIETDIKRAGMANDGPDIK